MNNKETLQQFKENVMEFLKVSHNKGKNGNDESTSRFWLRVKDSMNDNNNVFWSDVEMYYNDIKSRQDAILILETSNLSFKLNREIEMNTSYDTIAALHYSIFAKFFTKTDFEYTHNFWKRIYNQHVLNNSRKECILQSEMNNLIIMLLNAGL